MARQVIDALPIIDTERPGDYVFSLDGRHPLQGWSKYKQRLDDKMLAALRQQAARAGEDADQIQLKPWQLRDLRRTARTLLSRAKRETSRAQTAPTLPRQTSATIRSKPARCTPPAADRPRSSSITSISDQPSAVSRSRMAYCSALLSRLCNTWWAEDCRT
jgi:hypothetical protein